VPLSDWLKSRQQQEYTQVPPQGVDVPEGAWGKCEDCGTLIHVAQMEHSLNTCPDCGRHYPLTPAERIGQMTDPDSFVEWFRGLEPTDPLGFCAAKTYIESLDAAREKTLAEEAVVCGGAAIEGDPIALGVMDFRFIGGSMGSVVGEKVARLFERATGERLPVLMIIASGGARMQEGMLSLMQMAKTSAAIGRYRESGKPYIAVLTDPTSGGVTASFATLADVILAEPRAFVGFTGPRIIEQTMRQKLPKGFQTSESMLEHGLIDMIVPRLEQKKVIIDLLDMLGGRGA
jgi:acetyl-CoA carboxylase carboxyl transferase subunit beta